MATRLYDSLSRELRELKPGSADGVFRFYNSTMSGVVQRAVELGFDPIQAIQMVTLNVAEYFGLHGEVGAIAPGYRADVPVLPSLEELIPVGVIAGGRPAIWGGKAEVEAPATTVPVVASPVFPRPLRPEDFELAVRGRRGTARVRAIEIKGDIVTAERILELSIHDGRLVVDPDAGVWDSPRSTGAAGADS